MEEQAKQDKLQNMLAAVSLVAVVAMLVFGFKTPEMQTTATVSAVIAGSSGAISALIGILH
ncbi:hypothetical protein MAQ5080_00735 [Marinomonas aquimarina]|uniref:Uncharacterized protein n=1 Tax=Marinomonas aquimarina TaxID=295068 RepID=A0A1A8T7N0_9GAMM|nr:hypothetical protein [Marinomonas aquimarina]SBS27196.1 hypothetical protein MAQ5080_00735 [Marinomonas aquimarina]